MQWGGCLRGAMWVKGMEGKSNGKNVQATDGRGIFWRIDH